LNKICIIINPEAHSSRAQGLIEKLNTLCSEVWPTKCRGDAQVLAMRAVREGFDTVVAAGGDGTINEVVNGLAGSSVALGILPVGTINVFASEIKIPQELLEAWEMILKRETQLIDLPSCNEHYFVQLAGVGIDAAVVEETTRKAKQWFGPFSYLMTLLRIASRPAPHLQLTVDGINHYEGAFVLVGNGRSYGGSLKIFKNAYFQDGLLDVCLFQKCDHGALLKYSREAFFGAHLNDPEVTYLQCKTLRVESETEVPVEVDGESLGHLPCLFQIGRQKLNVIFPDPASAKL
jgi:YegS/Rv2252/BmrU family lipid kinase